MPAVDPLVFRVTQAVASSEPRPVRLVPCSCCSILLSYINSNKYECRSCPDASLCVWGSQDARLRALFTFQDLYVGLSPQAAPGVFSLLAATELVDGVWYPVGGFQKASNATMSFLVT
jgi:hypothetical protein